MLSSCSYSCGAGWQGCRDWFLRTRLRNLKQGTQCTSVTISDWTFTREASAICCPTGSRRSALRVVGGFGAISFQSELFHSIDQRLAAEVEVLGCMSLVPAKLLQRPND